MLALQLLFNSLVFGTEVALMGLCLLIIHNVGGVFAIGIAGIGVAIAYAYYFGGIFLALGCALILGLAHFALLEIYSCKKLSFLGLIVSLSFGAALEALVSIIFGSDNKDLSAVILPVFHVQGLTFPLASLVVLGLGLGIAVIADFLWKKTSLGRTMRALSESTETSESLGIHSKKVRMGLHIAAALIVGLLILMKGFRTSLTPTMGLYPVVYAFIALIVGGLKSIRGLVLSSYLIIVIPVFIIGLTSLQDKWFLVLVFAIASLILSIFPQGISTLKTRTQ
jgi:branched-chain amino acid transport system permease protein